MRLYDLRKFGASAVYDRTGNVEVTAEFTGHVDTATLLARYIHAPRGAAEEAAPRIGWAPSPLRLVDEEGEP